MKFLDIKYTMEEKYIKDTFESLGIKMTKPSIKFVSLIMAHIHLISKHNRDSDLITSITNTDGYSPQGMRKLLNYLEYHNYILVDRGYKFKDGLSDSSKISCLDKCDTLPHISKSVGKYSGDRIVLTKPISDKNDIPKEVRRKGRLLDEYSDMLSDFSIQLYSREMDTNYIRSIYTGDFDHHGRIYAPWQWIRSTDRENIQIDNEPTDELDFSGMGVNIVYNLHGRTLRKDAYGFDSGLTRSENKKIMSIALNTGSKRSAAYTIRNHIPHCKDVDSVLSNLEIYHLPISQSLYKNIGMKIMNIDSKVCEKVIRSMIYDNMPVLSIHDGFVTSKNNILRLKEIMEESYESVLKHKSPIIH